MIGDERREKERKGKREGEMKMGKLTRKGEETKVGRGRRRR